MHPLRQVIALVVTSLCSVTATPATQTLAAISGDTTDVPVGSALVDGTHLRPYAMHLQVHRTSGGQTTLVQEATNTIAPADPANASLLHVTGTGEALTPAGRAPITIDITFDRRTLALLDSRQTTPRGEAILRARDLEVAAHAPTPAGPKDVTLRLTRPAFYGPWVDLVVEELPMRLGATYRVDTWQPAMRPGSGLAVTEETHLYVVRAREDVEVFGATHRQAWVVEDRSADGATLLGRMWIIDAAPRLVRWTIYAPNGDTTVIDQELATPPR